MTPDRDTERQRLLRPARLAAALALTMGVLLLAALGCESGEGSRVASDTPSAEVFSCPEAELTWTATKGTCPLLGRDFELRISDCVIAILALGDLEGQPYPDASWEGVFTSATAFDLGDGPVGWECSGGWSGASADLTCETETGSLCVLTLEASCIDVAGVWRVNSGMCFDYDVSYTLAQDLSCGLTFQQGGVSSSAVPGPASIDGGSVSFEHAQHGACVGAIVTGSFKGQCDDGCTFEMTRKQ